MPRGGSRPGAGRKPKSAVVLGMDGSRRETSAPAASTPAAAAVPPPTSARRPDQVDLAQPPSDLSEKRQEFWRVYAPTAVAEGTLTEGTVVGFRELSAQFVIEQDLLEQMESYRLLYVRYLDYVKTTPPAEVGPQLSQLVKQIEAFNASYQDSIKLWTKVSQRVDSTLARFKLTAMGKPDTARVKAKPVANPWGAFATPTAKK